MADIEHVRPCAGVLPFADRRHDTAAPVSWRKLDRQLAGVFQRRGRTGDKWLWRADGPALATMANVYQQTARASDVGRADLREPAWLGDECYCLSPREARLIVGLLSVYEAKWGGLADCQSSVAVALRVGDERTLRNLLWGTSWTNAAGEKRRRPGLVERGFVTAVQLYKPGRPDGRPSDMHWLLLRIGPTIERAALWAALGKDWTGRAPRLCGWSKGRARAVVNGLRARVCRERYHAAGVAWARRSRPPGRPGRDAPGFHAAAELGQALEIRADLGRDNTLERAAQKPVTTPVTAPPGYRSGEDLEVPARISGEPQASAPIGELVDLGEVSAAFVRLQSERADTEHREALAQARRECRELRAEFGDEIDADNAHAVAWLAASVQDGLGDVVGADHGLESGEALGVGDGEGPASAQEPQGGLTSDGVAEAGHVGGAAHERPQSSRDDAGVTIVHNGGDELAQQDGRSVVRVHGRNGIAASNYPESVSDNPAHGALRSSGPLGRLGGSGGSVAPPPRGSPTGIVPPLTRRPDFMRDTAETDSAVRSKAGSLPPSNQAKTGAALPPPRLPDSVRARLGRDELRSIDRLCKLDPQLGASVVRLTLARFGTVDDHDHPPHPDDHLEATDRKPGDD